MNENGVLAGFGFCWCSFVVACVCVVLLWDWDVLKVFVRVDGFLRKTRESMKLAQFSGHAVMLSGCKTQTPKIHLLKYYFYIFGTFGFVCFILL